jgi:hypothetical protein
MKKLIISFFTGFIILVAIGSIIANFVFLPKFAELHQLHPDVVRATLDPLSGALQAILQLAGLVALVDRMKMTKLINGALLGAIYSAGIWLIVDLNMMSLTTLFDYNYIVMDAVISAFIGGVLGAVVTWTQNKFV